MGGLPNYNSWLLLLINLSLSLNFSLQLWCFPLPVYHGHALVAESMSGFNQSFWEIDLFSDQGSEAAPFSASLDFLYRDWDTVSIAIVRFPLSLRDVLSHHITNFTTLGEAAILYTGTSSCGYYSHHITVRTSSGSTL